MHGDNNGRTKTFLRWKTQIELWHVQTSGGVRGWIDMQARRPPASQQNAKPGAPCKQSTSWCFLRAFSCSGQRPACKPAEGAWDQRVVPEQRCWPRETWMTEKKNREGNCGLGGARENETRSAPPGIPIRKQNLDSAIP